MPRGDAVPRDVVKVIWRIYHNDTKLNAKEVAYQLRQELGEKKSKKYSWPSDVYVRKCIAKLKSEKPSPEDQPWHMGTLDQYPLSPEALKTVIQAHWFAVEHGSKLTIREAKWIGRLSAVPEMFPELKDKEAIPWLIRHGCEYAELEAWSEASGGAFEPYIPGDPEDYLMDEMLLGHWNEVAANYLQKHRPAWRPDSVAEIGRFLRSSEHKEEVHYWYECQRRLDAWRDVKKQNPELREKLGKALDEAIEKIEKIERNEICRSEHNDYTKEDWAAMESAWEDFDRLLDSYKKETK